MQERKKSLLTKTIIICFILVKFLIDFNNPNIISEFQVALIKPLIKQAKLQSAETTVL
jgi:hypothetical protein